MTPRKSHFNHILLAASVLNKCQPATPGKRKNPGKGGEMFFLGDGTLLIWGLHTQPAAVKFTGTSITEFPLHYRRCDYACGPPTVRGLIHTRGPGQIVMGFHAHLVHRLLWGIDLVGAILSIWLI